MKVQFIYLTFLLIVSINSFGQESFTIMQYNLLYYGSYTSFCTQSNNNIDDKAEYLASIIDYYQPDIFTVNEMASSQYAVNHLLGNALNVNGVNHYRAAAILNNDDSDIINMLYYNNTLFELLSQESVSTEIRDINIYQLRHLGLAEDIRFRVVVMHLKAGSYQEDQADRNMMTSELMDYLSDVTDKRNYILAGDFNVQSDSENAFQNLVSPAAGNIVFVDPINQLGQWNNNYSMRYYHTQSTHDSDEGCPSYGGMDDRFDFILVSDDVMTGENDLLYVEDSYFVAGQDGNRFNGSLISPSNSSAPSEVINAMYEFSDHLPVLASFEIGNSNNILSSDYNANFTITSWTLSQQTIEFTWDMEVPEVLNLELYNMLGQKLSTNTIHPEAHGKLTMPCAQDGMLILRVCNESGECHALRFVK
jgi:exonuclease III